MTKPARRARYLLFIAVALTMIAAPCAAFASTAGAYLNWSAKAQPMADAPSQTEQVHTATGAYPVPPSPYGQVGDPYARSLRWPTKQTPAVTSPAVASISQPPRTTFAPVPTAPMRAPAPVSVSQPVPMTMPKPVAVISVPQRPEPEDPGFADDPDLTPEAPIASAPVHQSAAPPRPQPAPRPEPKITPKATPAIASAPSPVHSETAPLPAALAPALNNAMSTDTGYEVPTTSKYAARIAAVRAAALPVAEAPKTGKADPKSTATAPEPDVSLASQETDHVFIPGEHYTTPADEPRLYSLHRQYGMRPDPITVSSGATGALLTVSPDEGGDPNDDDKTSNTGSKKSDTDKN